MFTIGKISKFLKECYNELRHKIVWTNIYELQSYCVIVMLFIFIVCAVTLLLDFSVQYILSYLYK